MRNLELREQDKQRIKSKEMKFLRRQAKYTWQDYKTNENSSSISI
jgi:ABC-type ATPase involved in cell division